MIELPFQLGYKIREEIYNYRKENNIPDPEEYSKIKNPNNTFLEEELDCINKIVVDKEILPYIKYFKNIKELEINDKYQISDEELSNILDSHQSIETLRICHQRDLYVIDISNLKHLKNIDISFNYNLCHIKGFKIDSNINLEKISVFDNSNLSNTCVALLCQLAYYNVRKNNASVELDPLYMKKMVEYAGNCHKDVRDLASNIKWVEGINLDSKIINTTDDVYAAYEEAKNIVFKYTNEFDTPEQIYAIIYTWIIQNIKYDTASLDNHFHMENGKEIGQKFGTNSCVNGFLYRTCVCEGYTKMAQLMLDMRGIKSSNVLVLAENNKENEYLNHSIIRVCFGDHDNYTDITYGAKSYFSKNEYIAFLQDKEEVDKEYLRVLDNKNVISKKYTLDEYRELYSFALKRINEIDNKRANAM